MEYRPSKRVQIADVILPLTTPLHHNCGSRAGHVANNKRGPLSTIFRDKPSVHGVVFNKTNKPPRPPPAAGGRCGGVCVGLASPRGSSQQSPEKDGSAGPFFPRLANSAPAWRIASPAIGSPADLRRVASGTGIVAPGTGDDACSWQQHPGFFTLFSVKN